MARSSSAAPARTFFCESRSRASATRASGNGRPELDRPLELPLRAVGVALRHVGLAQQQREARVVAERRHRALEEVDGLLRPALRGQQRLHEVDVEGHPLAVEREARWKASDRPRRVAVAQLARPSRRAARGCGVSLAASASSAAASVALPCAWRTEPRIMSASARWRGEASIAGIERPLRALQRLVELARGRAG